MGVGFSSKVHDGSICDEPIAVHVVEFESAQSALALAAVDVYRRGRRGNARLAVELSKRLRVVQVSSGARPGPQGVEAFVDVEYIGGQLMLIFPVIFYWAVRSRKKLPISFHYLAWTPLLFFVFTTYRGYVEANWPIVAYPASLCTCRYGVSAELARHSRDRDLVGHALGLDGGYYHRAAAVVEVD